jgi:thiol-disulfide isomerase/thioredoxin
MPIVIVARRGRRAAQAALTAALAVLSIAGGARAQRGSGPPPIAVGARAPGAPVQRLDGTALDLAHYFGRTPVVIEFWAKWCGNCRALEPAVRRAQTTFGDRVRIVTVAVSIDEAPPDVAQYARAHRFPPDVVYDPDGSAVDAYGAPGTSFTVVVTPARKVVYTGEGGEQDLVAAIRKAL